MLQPHSLNASRSVLFPFNKRKSSSRSPFLREAFYCIMETAQIFIQDFAKRFCFMFISSNQLSGLREAFLTFTLSSKHSSDSQFEGFLQLWFNDPRLPAGRAFYTNFLYYNILIVSISFVTSNQTLLVGRCC